MVSQDLHIYAYKVEIYLYSKSQTVSTFCLKEGTLIHHLIFHRSVLTSVAPVAIEGHADSWDLDDHLGSCCCLRFELSLEPCQSGWLMQSGSVLTSMALVATRT